ncbi:MAG: hypothetical protein J6A75_05015 [Lachnospiraceae bacterium]|nr:hypothetical protein [Lachnospiraceae bacterium]
MKNVIQMFISPVAVLIYEIIVFGILLVIIIRILMLRKRKKNEIVNYREAEKKNMLNKALTNEKRGGRL